MRKKHFTAFMALGFFAAAGLCLAQNADRNTAGPTKNDLKLRVTEPAEGATITGGSVRVAVDYNRPMFGAGQGTKFGEATFPPPKFNVFLDGKLQQTLMAGEANVATLENVAPGNHKIVIEAANLSGEVIDRKEINIQTISETASASAATSAPVQSSASAPSYEPPRPSSPPPAAQAAPPPAPETPSTLPQTGSSAPRLAAAGLALALSGVLLSRKAR
jgi:LPXTG-motif cell wall-anchored protein